MEGWTLPLASPPILQLSRILPILKIKTHKVFETFRVFNFRFCVRPIMPYQVKYFNFMVPAGLTPGDYSLETAQPWATAPSTPACWPRFWVSANAIFSASTTA